MPSSRVLYFAEPIDNAPEAPEWRATIDAVSRIATKRGWLVYRPSRSWDVSPEDIEVGPEIETVNRVMMANSGGVVAHFPPDVVTVGTPRELEWARANGVPAIAMYVGRPSWSLYDCDQAEFGDLAGFGLWLKDLEMSHHRGPRPDPLSFLLEGGTLPTRVNEGDAGFDLYISETTEIPPGEFVDVPCGVRVALPPGVFARITGRSSTLRKRGLLVAEGIIDNGYRGPIYAGVRNLNGETVVVREGDRIAQLLLHDNIAARHAAVSVDRQMWNRIPGDSRGESGFGSTGD